MLLILHTIWNTDDNNTKDRDTMTIWNIDVADTTYFDHNDTVSISRWRMFTTRDTDNAQPIISIL